MAVLAAVTVVACASADRPVAHLTRAETSIELAEQNGAREHGAVALDRARNKLSQAKRSADEGDHEQARRLAEQSQLDAELAAAQASRGKANASLAEVNDSIETLRREIARDR